MSSNESAAHAADDTGVVAQQAKDVSLMAERVAAKSLTKISKRLGIAFMVLIGFVGLEVVFRMKGIALTEPWWVFQIMQTQYFVDTRTIMFEMRWILPLVFGLLLCGAVTKALAAAGREKMARGLAISRVGLIVSVVALVVIALGMFKVVDMRMTSQVWLYPISFVGISAGMLSLAISREGTERDGRLGIITALVPIILMAILSVLTVHTSLWKSPIVTEPALSDYALAAFLWTAVAYALTGLRLDSLYRELTYDKLAKWAGWSLAFSLVLIGAITNGPRSFFVDLRWIGAASAGLFLSMLVAWMISRPKDVNKRPEGSEGAAGPEAMISTVGLGTSLALLALSLIGGAHGFNLGSPDWLFPASIAGIALAMTSLTIVGSGNAWDKAVSYCAIALAVVVMGLPVIRSGNAEWIGYALGVLGIVVLVFRLQSVPNKEIPVKRLAGRRRALEALGLACLVASTALLALFVVSKSGAVGEAPFIEGALIITALAMFVLLLTRTTLFWEKVATLGLAGTAVFVSALPAITRWSVASHPGTVISLYIGAAALFLLSGIRPVTMYTRATVLREKSKLGFTRTWKVMRQVLRNPMGVVGTVILLFFVALAAFGPEIAPYNIPSGAGHPGIDQWEKYLTPSETKIPAPSYVVDVVWGIPLVAALLAAVTLLGLGQRSKSGTKARPPLAVVAFILTAGLLALAALDALNVMELGRPEWLYPASAAGALLLMLGFSLSPDSRKSRKGLIGLALVAVAAGLVVAPMFMGSSLGALSQELFITFIAAGAVVVAAGMLLFKSIKDSSGLPPGMAPPSAKMAKTFGIAFGAAFILAGLVAMFEGNWTAHWMGTDTFGYDTFSELLYGARTSIIVGIFSAVIASVLGALVGLYSGYVGGWADEVIMRANDVVLSIPWLVLMIIVAAMIGTIDLTGIILIIGLTGWSTTARMVRAQVLSIRERQYIERARAIGSADLAIIRRHVLPNAFPLVFANTILTVAVSILSEATLSFLGMRPVGVVTWGTMLSYASSANAFAIGLHWWIVAPGMCIVVIVLGFTLLGYALDDVLNPKLRKR